MTLGDNSKKSVATFPYKELTNKCIQVLLSFDHILWHALENAIKCSLVEMVPFPENLEKWSLNFGRGFAVGARSKGEYTCHSVLVASSSNQNKPKNFITLTGLVVDWTGTWWLKIIPIMDEEELCEDVDELVLEEDHEFHLERDGNQRYKCTRWIR